jgi:alpha-glucoside transport system permease protein
VIAQIISAMIVIAVAIGLSILFFVGSNYLLDRYLSSDSLESDNDRQRRDNIREGIRPWIFVGPAVLVLVVYLVYPVFASLIYSMQDRNADGFVGFANYIWAFGNDGFRIAIRNNILWLIIVPTMSSAFGLVIAYMTDRLWWGQVARTLVFLPMAISFVGASVIWKFIYDYKGSGEEIGLLNAVVMALGGEPQAWISLQPWNNLLLMVILIWIQTGFAMVILGAAIRGVPEDTIEASIMEGANNFQIFFKIVIPQIFGTIVVVWTTITILVLKIFDIVFAMTNGQWETQVLANFMYDQLFRSGDIGRGSAVAIVIMLAVTPVMIYNIRRARMETR